MSGYYYEFKNHHIVQKTTREKFPLIILQRRLTNAREILM